MDTLYFLHEHARHCIISKSSQPAPSNKLFTLFPQLPPEIRLRIWFLIAFTPRTVEISCLPSGHLFSHTPSPILFYINAESRSIALSTYKPLSYPLAFSTAPLPFRSRKIYMNFRADTLWLCDDLGIERMRELLENETLEKEVRFLSVKEELWRTLNECLLTPIPDASPSGIESPKIAMVTKLKMLKEVKFHEGERLKCPSETIGFH